MTELPVGSYGWHWEQTRLWGLQRLKELTRKELDLVAEWSNPVPYKQRIQSFSVQNLETIFLVASLEMTSSEVLETLFEYAENWDHEPGIGVRIVGHPNCSKEFLEVQARKWWTGGEDWFTAPFLTSISTMALANPNIGDPLSNIPDFKNYKLDENKLGELALTSFIINILSRNVPTSPDVLQWLLECHLSGLLYKGHNFRIPPASIVEHPNCKIETMRNIYDAWREHKQHGDYLLTLGVEAVLQTDTCPVEIIQDASLSSCESVRRLAVLHPLCPETYRIGGVLLG